MRLCCTLVEIWFQVEAARGEVDKLLKMVRNLEKENTQLSSQCKQLQSAIERGGTDGGSGGTLTKVVLKDLRAAFGCC